MKKTAALLLFFCSTAMGAYNYTTPLIVNHGKVGGVESNFPVLLSTNSVLMSTASAGGHMLNSSGYDLVFSTYPDCHYLLHWDTETVNNTGSAQLNVWVQVPSLSNTTDTVFYACYGNTSITTYQGNSKSVWDSNYAGVYHLPNGAASSLPDSTSQNNAVNNSGTAVTGQIDGAMGLLSSQYASIPGSTSLENPSVTVSAWVKYTSPSDYAIAVSRPYHSGAWASPYASYALFASESTGGTPLFLVSVSGSSFFIHSSVNIADNTWHYIVGVFSSVASTGYLYTDGSINSSMSISGSIDYSGATTPSIGIGTQGGTVLGQYLNGSIDEIRISKSARTADWISTEYNNQSAPSSFLIFDTEVNNTTAFENEKGIVLDGGKLTLKSGRITVK